MLPLQNKMLPLGLFDVGPLQFLLFFLVWRKWLARRFFCNSLPVVTFRGRQMSQLSMYWITLLLVLHFISSHNSDWFFKHSPNHSPVPFLLNFSPCQFSLFGWFLQVVLFGNDEVVLQDFLYTIFWKNNPHTNPEMNDFCDLSERHY